MAVITGTAAAERLRGTVEGDVLSGQGGNDTLDGSSGADVLNGGDGDDVLIAGDGADLLQGGSGHDTLNAGAGSDTLDGGDGDDLLQFESFTGAATGQSLMLGGNGADTLRGGDRADTLSGGAGRDWLEGGGGHDILDGGVSVDTARWSGSFADYTVTIMDVALGRAFVEHKTGSQGRDTLVGVERLRFNQLELALDLSKEGAAGQALLLVGAVIGRELTMGKRELMAEVISLFDQGFNLQTLAEALMRLPIWAGVLTPSDSATDKAAHLLRTVTGAEPSAEDIEDGAAGLTQSPGGYLAALALSAENIAQVGLVGLAATGFHYPVPG